MTFNLYEEQIDQIIKNKSNSFNNCNGTAQSLECVLMSLRWENIWLATIFLQVCEIFLNIHEHVISIIYLILSPHTL